jgi:type II secretory pathway component GspD/PulD (secretin)
VRSLWSLYAVLAVTLQMMPGLAASPAFASSIPNGDRVFLYAVIDQKLSDVLAALGDQIGVNVNISAGVKGHIRGRLDPAPARVMLDRLATIYQLDWYFYGGTLFVSSTDEATSVMLRLPQASDDAFFDTIKQLQIEDPRWPLTVSATAEVVAVNGPPQYIKLVEQALTAVSHIPPAPEANARVFRGATDN